MKKDSEDSDSDKCLDLNVVQELSEKIENINKANEQLMKAYRELELERERLLQKMRMNSKEQTEEKSGLNQHLENIDIQDEMPHSDFPVAHKQWPDSPKASPIREPKNFSYNTFEILDLPSVQAGSSKQSGDTLSQIETKIHETFTDINASSTLNTSQNTEDDVTQSARTGAKFETQQSLTDSEEHCDGKGKGASNPKYRYKKRSKPEPSAMEIASHETPVKPSKECGSSGQKTLQSPEVDVTRISPGVKRKELASDEGCSSWTFSGNSSNDTDDLKVAKKLKLEVGNLSSTISTLSFRNDNKSYDSSPNTDQSETYQGIIGSKQLKLSSTRGLSSNPSSSEESFNLIENEFKDIKMPTLSSRSDDVARLEREESVESRRSSVSSLQRQNSFPFSENERRERKISTLSSISEDLSYGEKESSIISRRFSVSSLQRQESSQSTASFRVPSSERAESSLASISDDAMFRDIDSPLPTINDELPLSEVEESSLTSVNEVVPLGEIRDSFLTNVSDLSELIATTNYEQCDSPQDIAQSQIDRSRNEIEKLNLPSTSGLSNIGSYASLSIDTSHISGKNDATYRPRKKSSLTGSSDDVTSGEQNSGVTSSDDDVTSGEQNSGVTSSDDDVTGSESVLLLSHRSNDFTRRDEESTQSTLKLDDSFLTNACDLSELIPKASDEGSSSEAS